MDSAEKQAQEFLASKGLADSSLYWPTNKPLPQIDYESGEAQPTLLQLLAAYAALEKQKLITKLKNWIGRVGHEDYYKSQAKLLEFESRAEVAEGERDSAVAMLRVIGEELVNAGYPSGDREQTLANVRALCKTSIHLRNKLALIYDRWDAGTDCYEAPEDHAGYLGKAVKLSLVEEEEILSELHNGNRGIN